MAINRVARPVSLVFTKTTGGGSVTISELKGAEVEDTQDLPAVMNGLSLVDTRYQGKKSGSFKITTAKLVSVIGLRVGMKVESVVLTAEAAGDSEGVAVGENVTKTMSKGIITEIGQPSLSNDSRQPATVELKIELANHEGDSSDATISDWTVVV